MNNLLYCYVAALVVWSEALHRVIIAGHCDLYLIRKFLYGSLTTSPSHRKGLGVIAPRLN